MKMRIGSLLILFLMIAGVAGLGSACGPVAGGDLRVALYDPPFIDPSLVVESEGRQVAQALFDCLTEFDPITSELRPGVARSWEGNKEATVWTFHLKEGTRFHNGREVVAGDFKYSWERLCDPETQSYYGGFLEAIAGFGEFQAGDSEGLSGVKVVDDYTLEVTLSMPLADFPMLVGEIHTAPIPREEVEKDPGAFGMMPIGNGSFMMTEPWQQGEYIKVQRFAGYEGEKPLVDGIDFRIYVDKQAAYLDFESGELDWCQVPAGQFQSAVQKYGLSKDGYTSDPGRQVQDGAEVLTYYLALNNEDDLLSDVHLRRALSLAINRDAIVEVVWQEGATAASSCLPEGLLGWEAGQWQYCKYDVEAARSELEAAGYPDGEGLPPLVVTYNAGARFDEFVQLVAADLRQIGVDVEFDGLDGPSMQGKIMSGDYQIGQAGWGTDYPSIDGFITPLFSPGLPSNSDRYTPEQDILDAMASARQLLDGDERLSASQEVVQKIGDDCPNIPIASAAHMYVASDRVHDLVCSPLYLMDFTQCWISE